MTYLICEVSPHGFIGPKRIAAVKLPLRIAKTFELAMCVGLGFLAESIQLRVIVFLRFLISLID